MAKKSPEAPPEKVALYETLLATQPEIERKGAGNPYTSINGNMFSYIPASGKMALRLPVGVREQFLEQYQTTLYEAYGIIQKEYVTVPDDLLGNTEELAPYLAQSLEYAKTLKPKPSKKA